MRSCEEVGGDADERRTADHVRPDIARLRVQPKDRAEASAERRQRGPVPVMKIVVILEPLGKQMEMRNTPAGVPDLCEKQIKKNIELFS